MDIDLSEAFGGSNNRLKTSLPGVEVSTAIGDADPDELEAVHRRQLEWALDHADDATEATRM